MDCIDGSIKKPEEASAQYMAWMRYDVMIKGWLATVMEKAINSSVSIAVVAVLWTNLEERFGKESTPRVYKLKQTLNNTSQEGASISSHYIN